jgi:hypothetical protein
LILISPPFLLVLTAIVSMQVPLASRASSAPPVLTAAGSADCRDLDEVNYSKARSEGLRKIDIVSLPADAAELTKLTGLRQQRSLQGTQTAGDSSGGFHPSRSVGHDALTYLEIALVPFGFASRSTITATAAYSRNG